MGLTPPISRALALLTLLLAACVQPSAVSVRPTVPALLPTAAELPAVLPTARPTRIAPVATAVLSPTPTFPPTWTPTPLLPTPTFQPTWTPAPTALPRPLSLPPAPLPAPDYAFIGNITARAREIYQRGVQAGARPGVFSKVGDSLTVATYVLYPFGWGRYNLRDYTYLQPALDYFSAAAAREGSSFANISLAADNGWTTRTLLDPASAHPQFCAGDTPLACEYRLVRPSLALILIGTNDVGYIPAEEYAANLRQIIEITISFGAVPVLTTLPDRFGYSDGINRFNGAIMELAAAYGVPLWDYGGAMRALPNGGLSEDGVHPSWPPGGYEAAADFSADNLRYGYTLRNWMALHVLDAIWRAVMA